MSRNISVALGPHFTSFIDAQVQCGHYASANDVVRAGLQLLEEHEAKVKALKEGLQSAGRPRLTLAQKLKAFDPALHGGEVMATGRVGAEVF